jgi:Domain of unknown function (DUF4157)/L,D-transpeptidase catalytic domain
MSKQTQVQVKASSTPKPHFAAVPSRLLQRKCACGGNPGVDGECEECRKEKLSLQRRATDQAELATVPPIVHDVLRSPGQPLDKTTRAYMEPRFGHDFSQVRVHTDARAVESARAVNALAYTVGRNVVFGVGQYATGTMEGRRLLAHELTHVVQQEHTMGPLTVSPMAITDSDGLPEQEAVAVAAQVVNGSYVPGIGATATAVQRVEAPYINKVTVNLTEPENVTLSWKGTAPQGSDNFSCTTGKGYSNPEDDPGTCSRSCCSGAGIQCAPPYDRPEKIGSCCTPIGTNFWTGKPLPEHNGWLYWTPVEPIHTSGHRGIALHQHNEVTGKAIGHGCIRMKEENAKRIYDYSRGRATNVTITGRATVDCPDTRQCSAKGKTGALESIEGADQLAISSLTRPDEENAGGGGGAAPEMPTTREEEALV